MEKPTLAPPGAGLPFPASILAKFVFMPLFSRLTSWEESKERFNREGERILSLLKGVDPSKMNTPVLVPPMPGLEDSSRYWSVQMCLEHLLIVGEGISGFIVLLSQGKSPEIKVEIKNVKPKGESNFLDTKNKFEEFVASKQEWIEKNVQDKTSKKRHLHPWFGKITASQWHWLLGAHQGIHRKQIQEILKRL